MVKTITCQTCKRCFEETSFENHFILLNCDGNLVQHVGPSADRHEDNIPENSFIETLIAETIDSMHVSRTSFRKPRTENEIRVLVREKLAQLEEVSDALMDQRFQAALNSAANVITKYVIISLVSLS